MSRIRIALTASLVAFGLLVPGLGQARTQKTILNGTTGPGFTITLKTTSGKKVTKLKAGVYAIKVADKSSIHNYRLKGPGVNKEITGVKFVGTKTAIFTLKPGKYTYVCDPHKAIMKGSFTVS